MTTIALPIVPRHCFTEERLHHFSAELAEVAHAAGIDRFTMPDRFFARDIGNGQQFVRVDADVRDGDLLSATYKQVHGCVTILIIND